MWDMAKNSIILFLQGRLFQDLGAVIRQAFIGIIITALVMMGLHIYGPQIYPELELWMTAAIGGLIGGFIQPFLFKNLKYA